MAPSSVSPEDWGDVREALAINDWERLMQLMSFNDKQTCFAQLEKNRKLCLYEPIRSYVESHLLGKKESKRGFLIRFFNGHGEWSFSHGYGMDYCNILDSFSIDIRKAAERVAVRSASYYVLPMWTEDPIVGTLNTHEGQLSYSAYRLKRKTPSKVKHAIERARQQAFPQCSAQERALFDEVKVYELKNLQGELFDILESKGDVTKHILDVAGGWPAPWEKVMLKHYISCENVVNIRSGEQYDIYIGRTNSGLGAWGNPYMLENSKNAMIARMNALSSHALYIEDRIKKEGDQFAKELMSLRGKRLGCFCSPLPCHGDTLAKLAELENAEQMLDKITAIKKEIKSAIESFNR